MHEEDVKKHSEFERLITAAHVYRRRGEYSQAEQTIREALDISPSDTEAREFAADMLFARGELEEAAEEYKRISEQDESRPSAEEKYATAILQIAEGKRQQELLKEMLENPAKFRAPARSPLLAALISTAPGFGHLYCGQLVKGVVLFVGAMFFWLLFYAFSPPVNTSLGVQERIYAFATNMSVPALFFLCVAIFMHIYAFVDAAVLADSTRQNAEASNPAEPE